MLLTDRFTKYAIGESERAGMPKVNREELFAYCEKIPDKISEQREIVKRLDLLAEKIKILEDGSIPQVEITSCGLNGGPLVAKGEYPAPICCALTDGNMPHGSVSRVIPHITCANDERFISEIGNGTLIGYKYFDFEGEAKLTLKYRSGKEAPNGEFVVRHQINGDPVAKISVKPSENWTNAQAMLDTKGTRALYLEYKGDGLVDLITFSFD
jgi:hypothetical protein